MQGIGYSGERDQNPNMALGSSPEVNNISSILGLETPKEKVVVQEPRGWGHLSEMRTVEVCPAGASQNHGGETALAGEATRGTNRSRNNVFSLLSSHLLLVLHIVQVHPEAS